MRRRLAVVLLFCLPLCAAAADDAQTILHLLDYVGVDYSEAVEGGKVKNEDEYNEMLEFTAQVGERLEALPQNPRKSELVARSRELTGLVAAKAAPQAIAAASGELRRAIVQAYNVRVAPRAAPPLARAKALYEQHCAACHGANGRSDGPAARGLEPPPANFQDHERMAQRSPYGLYNTITLGVQGTSMAAFDKLSEEDRWALAFFVSVMGVPEAQIAEGKRLWARGEARRIFPDLDNVATLSANETAARYGKDATLVQRYLLAHPEAVQPSPIEVARRQLAQAHSAYARGDVRAARDAAVRAYLEGFELIEASLANIDLHLMQETERAMLEVRSAIERSEALPSLAQRIEHADALLGTAAKKLVDGGLSGATAFTASLIILLREGLEAILVLAAIIAFVAKTGRRDALPWVHAGWVTALALGALTWLVATRVVAISGANRELTEGVTALVAAGVLLYVGYWLHAKSYAQAWSQFIKQQVGQALARRTLWAMAAISFLAVYRELFEIVLFYEALWLQAGEANRAPVLGGAAAAAALLALVGVLIFKYSLRLPIGRFFAAMSALLAVLALVFTGHGIAALQEAGAVPLTPLHFEPVPLLGIYPSVEALGAQLLMLVLLAASFWSARRSAISSPPLPTRL